MCKVPSVSLLFLVSRSFWPVIQNTATTVCSQSLCGLISVPGIRLYICGKIPRQSKNYRYLLLNRNRTRRMITKEQHWYCPTKSDRTRVGYDDDTAPWLIVHHTLIDKQSVSRSEAATIEVRAAMDCKFDGAFAVQETSSDKSTHPLHYVAEKFFAPLDTLNGFAIRPLLCPWIISLYYPSGLQFTCFLIITPQNTSHCLDIVNKLLHLHQSNTAI